MKPIQISVCVLVSLNYFPPFLESRHPLWLDVLLYFVSWSECRLPVICVDSVEYDVYCAGTMERVCVILGSQTGIRSVLDVIVEKIRDKPDSHGVPAELKVTIRSTFEH